MNTEMDATPPAGYVECPKKCGRHCPPMPQQAMCWSCWDGYALPNKAEAPGARLSHPDWQPPIPAPQHKIEVKATVDGKCPLCGVAVPSTHIHLCSPQHVERRKGQVWRLTDGRDKSREYTLSHRYGATRWACKGFGDCGLEDVCWEGRYEMELIADATAEPGKCEPWCGYGLPPDDVCGYGFIDGPGDEREYFKLPGKSQRRKGYVFSWCSNECREKAIAPNAKAPPAHEAPKVMDCKATNPIDCGGCPEHAPWAAREIGAGCCDLSDAGYACNCIPTKLVRTRMHEAPKAAPVCSVKLYPHNDAAPVILRAWSKRLGPLPTCEACFLSLEKTAFEATVGTGTPYKGPERLRNVLARDELVEADWLPEAGR